MKTAVSLPDDLFALAEAEAKRLKVSRSELYARAIAKYVKHETDAEITRRLNEVYSEISSELDPALQLLQMRTLAKNEW